MVIISNMFHDEVNYHNKLRCSITIYFLFTLTCKSYYSQKQGTAVACLQLKNIYGEGNAVKSLDHSFLSYLNIVVVYEILLRTISNIEISRQRLNLCGQYDFTDLNTILSIG